MNHRVIIVAAVLFSLLIAGMFGFAYLKNQEQAAVVGEQDTSENEEDASRFDYIERVDAKLFQGDSGLTLVGEIPMPTPCDLLTTDAIVMESMPEQVEIRFDVINNAETCIQSITPARFKIAVAASKEATFQAYFDGRRVELNLIPAAPGETPEDFEVFVKG